MMGAAPKEDENQENRFARCMIFILRYKFGLFEIFVVNLFYFMFFVKIALQKSAAGSVADGKRVLACGEKQHCAHIRARVCHALPISEKMELP
ncbi:hypothetical protein GQ37_013470 [Janthinobacterium sp. BJB1]|nr:hypothetical protein CSQ90_19720 [Janthinobacterium sp. BJB303]PJC98076.1 hypothetical protein GQ37_013470 [Janthinobacterium sp. BJB1]